MSIMYTSPTFIVVLWRKGWLDLLTDDPDEIKNLEEFALDYIERTEEK